MKSPSTSALATADTRSFDKEVRDVHLEAAGQLVLL